MKKTRQDSMAEQRVAARFADSHFTPISGIRGTTAAQVENEREPPRYDTYKFILTAKSKSNEAIEYRTKTDDPP